MKLAERMTRIGIESAFEVLQRARALEAQGKKIVHLEIGQPDFPTPQHVMHTGGFTIGLIGLEQGDNEVVTAEIDWEGRVAESNEDNNVRSKQLLIDETRPTEACM